MNEAPQSSIYRVWLALKRGLIRIGEVQARILLTVFYFTIFGPFSLLVRRVDPLAIRPGKPRGWGRTAAPEGSEMDRATSQA